MKTEVYYELETTPTDDTYCKYCGCNTHGDGTMCEDCLSEQKADFYED